MTVIGPQEIAAALRRIRDRFATAEAELNAADARLGDGDTGTMLKRMADQLAAEDIAASSDASAAFQVLAMKATSSTGSSLGTLVVTALLTLARETRGLASVDISDLGRLVHCAVDAMAARGGAKPGDKTVLDGLLAVANALADNPGKVGATARNAARVALDRFRGEPNRIGRAGRYGENSRGSDDPGMLALLILCEALAN